MLLYGCLDWLNDWLANSIGFCGFVRLIDWLIGCDSVWFFSSTLLILLHRLTQVKDLELLFEMVLNPQSTLSTINFPHRKQSQVQNWRVSVEHSEMNCRKENLHRGKTNVFIYWNSPRNRMSLLCWDCWKQTRSWVWTLESPYPCEKRQLGLFVNENLHPIHVHFLVHFGLFFGVIQRVGETVAAALFHTDLQGDGIGIFRQQVAYSGRGGRCDVQCGPGG